MGFDWQRYHRKSIRLRGYDYTAKGAYFITICTKNRACLLGEKRNNIIGVNHAGMMVTKWYYKLEEKFSDIQCDAFICMPDHIHFIIINNVVSSVGADPCVCPHIDKWGERTGVNEKNIGKWGERTGVNEKNIGKWGEHTGSPLHRVIQWFKTMSTNDYIKNVKINNWIPFDGKLWQRNYYEHIIRNQYALENIRRYIINNPMRMDKNRRSNRMSSGRLK